MLHGCLCFWCVLRPKAKPLIKQSEARRTRQTLVVLAPGRSPPQTVISTTYGPWWPFKTATEACLTTACGQTLWMFVEGWNWATKLNNLHLGSNLLTQVRDIAKEPQRVKPLKEEPQRQLSEPNTVWVQSILELGKRMACTNLVSSDNLTIYDIDEWKYH